MLSMKTLRVAIVTMGSALLLGSNLVLAQTPAIDLDGMMAEAPSPILIATQTIPAATDTAPITREVMLGADAAIAITPGIALEAADRYFLRLELGGGAIFRDTVTVTGAGTSTPVQGGSGHDQAIFRLGEVSLTDTIQVSISDNIGLPSNGAADYTASMTVHEEQFAAIDGVGRIRSIGAEDVVVVRAVSGIDATITPANAVADVGVGFLWFVGPSSAMPNMSGAALGTAAAMAAMGQTDVLDASDGDMVTNDDLIHATGVTIGVEGDFSVGVWDLVAAMADEPNTPDVDESDVCPNRVGTEGNPTVQGMAGGTTELVPDEDDPTMTMLAGLAADTYQLCVEVDLGGPMSNTMTIPAGEYTATVYTQNTGDSRDNMMQSEGTIGAISRNGASVNIAYLTTSDKHNQRLIIVNRGSRPISITDISFQTEGGTEADLSDAAKAAAAVPGLNMIMPGETAVHRVAQMLSITGDSRRTAATLAFNGVAGQISVATTQVNLSDSSTDTVVWPVD